MHDDELELALIETRKALLVGKRRRLELAREARSRGWTYERIGSLLGMTRQSVYGMVDKMDPTE